MLDLNNKGFCVFGLPDGGKSTLTNYLLTAFGATALIYDTLNEFSDDPYDRYVPKDRGSVAELEAVIRSVMKARHYKLFVVDEANRFCPSKPATLPQAVADLNDWRAHYDLSTGFICRRPVQLHQDLTELCHYMFIFGLKGKNDIDYLNSFAAGLGDAVYSLKKYHFVVVNPDRTFSVFQPVPREFATHKKL